MKKILAGLILLVLTGLTFATESNEDFNFVKNKAGVKEYKLKSNGLTVLLYQDNSVPVTTINVTYLVGSRNEVLGTTGSTHILEHMMFKRTPNFNKEKGTDISYMFDKIGARINATTSTDRTNYFETLPSDKVDLALQIEAERMRNAIFTEEDLSTEMMVVRNEFEQGENNPVQVLLKELYSTAYQAHPYHHSTIGWKSDIENVTVEKLKSFYDQFYYPNNAVLSIVGDFEEREILKSVNKYFGKLEASKHKIPQLNIKEPKQLGERRFTINKPGGIKTVAVAYKSPKGLDKDSYSLKILNKILTVGQTSTLYKKVVEKGFGLQLFAPYWSTKDPAIYPVIAFVSPQHNPEIVEKEIIKAIEELKTNGIDPKKVEDAKNSYLAEITYARDGSKNIANQLNEAVAIGDWQYFAEMEENIKSVTPESVNEVLRKYFTEENRTVGYYLPLMNGAGAFGRPGNSRQFKEVSNIWYYRNPDNSLSKNIKAEKVNEVELAVVKTSAKNFVTFSGSIEAGEVWNSENKRESLITAGLLKKGTKNLSKEKITEELASIGASISFQTTSTHLEFGGKCLKKDLEKVVNLLAVQLKNPVFDKNEFENLKQRFIGMMMQQKSDAGARAQTGFLKQIYDKNHSSYYLSAEEVIQNIKNTTLTDIKNYHKKYYGSKTMKLVFAGDVDKTKIRSLVKKHFSNWTGGKAFNYRTNKKTKEAKVLEIPVPGQINTTVFVGQYTGLKKSDKDYLAFVVASNILGSNFSSRLMSTVREKEGLTYGISSTHKGDSFADGYWCVKSNFNHNLLDKGISSTLREIKKWYKDGVTEKELEDFKSTLIGQLKLSVETTGDLAGQILSNLKLNRDINYLETAIKNIENLSLEEVNSVIKKYINLKKLVIIKAGLK